MGEAGDAMTTVLRSRRFPRWWLLLVELAAACVVIGVATGGGTRVAAFVVAALVLVVTVVPIDGQWLLQRLGQTASLRNRVRGQRAQQGLGVVLGPYAVTSAGADARFGVARTASTAAVVVELRSDDLFNADPSFRLGDLTQLLTVEGVPLQSVRVLTLAVPPPGGGALCRTVSRFLVLAVATDTGFDALARRGGGRPGLDQLLRRVGLRGCEVLTQLGWQPHPADAATLGRLAESSLGPVSLPSTPGAEGRRSVTVGPTTSVTVSVAGDVTESLALLAEAVPALPVDLVVTSLVLTGLPEEHAAGVLVRVSAVGSDSALRDRTLAHLHSAGLAVTPLDGEQLQGLRWTLPFGVGE